jgi:hypothetical protein
MLIFLGKANSHLFVDALLKAKNLWELTVCCHYMEKFGRPFHYFLNDNPLSRKDCFKALSSPY